MGKSVTRVVALFCGVTLILGLTAMNTGYSFSTLLDTHFVTLKLEGRYFNVP